MCIEELTSRKFNSNKDFELFEEKLNLLTSSHELIEIGESSFKNIYFHQYKIPNTNTIYCLSIPENAWRGFFLPYEETKRHINYLKQNDKQKSKGCLFFILIIFAVVLTRIIFKNFF